MSEYSKYSYSNLIKLANKWKSEGKLGKPITNISFLILGNGWWLENANDPDGKLKNLRKKFIDFMNGIPLKEKFYEVIRIGNNTIDIDLSNHQFGNSTDLSDNFSANYVMLKDSFTKLMHSEGREFFVFFHLCFLIFKRNIEDSDENTYYENWFGNIEKFDEKAWIEYVKNFVKFQNNGDGISFGDQKIELVGEEIFIYPQNLTRNIVLSSQKELTDDYFHTFPIVNFTKDIYLQFCAMIFSAFLWNFEEIKNTKLNTEKQGNFFANTNLLYKFKHLMSKQQASDFENFEIFTTNYFMPKEFISYFTTGEKKIHYLHGEMINKDYQLFKKSDSYYDEALKILEEKTELKDVFNIDLYIYGLSPENEDLLISKLVINPSWNKIYISYHGECKEKICNKLKCDKHSWREVIKRLDENKILKEDVVIYEESKKWWIPH